MYSIRGAYFRGGGLYSGGGGGRLIFGGLRYNFPAY